MSQSIRIDESLHVQAKHYAKAERRTIAGQIEFWALMGKAALDNPDLPIDFVRDWRRLNLKRLVNKRASFTAK